jgi:amino acid transporter
VPVPGGGDVTVETPAAPVDSDPVMIDQTPTPLSAESEGSNSTEIEDRDPPFSPGGSSAWALLNLILTIVTALLMIFLFITYIMKRKEDDDDENDEIVKKHLGVRLISIIVTIGAIILFVLTEDMTLPMSFMDRYTLWHAVIAVVQIVIAVLSRKKYESNASMNVGGM